MIRRESLQKKRAIAAMAGIMMLLLAASCHAQTPLELDSAHSSDTCTNCNENATSLQGLGDADLSNSSIGPGLGAPELVSPSGTQNSGKLTYTWRGVSGGQNYCLVVKDIKNRVVIKQCCNALPAKTTYSITPRQTLASGDYSWSVSYKIRGRTLWSNQMDFTVCTSLPGKATLVSPKDTIGSKNPVFTWMPVNGAIMYRLTIAKAGNPNAPIFDETYLAEDVLSNIDQTCSVGPVLSQDLEEAVYYRWWIQTINCMGEGPRSYFKDFKYKTVIPGKPNPISPSGLISTNSPTFTWTAASAATGYHLEVHIRNKSPADDFILVDEGWFDASKVTKGYRCSGSLGPLPDDDSVFFWRVHASNDGGINGPWSSWRYFETVCAFKPGKNAKKARMG
ncbi:MAG: hypothetical protein PHS80_05175 [Methanothrix sp.]|nr:hypothetical protein [Methanothrix sp.]MDD4446257.1 hypothetical protein [Methanothrix sp.]